jgi:DNA polymerase I-like protein with 3'-5' exonuclease and polymerase domains
MVHSIVRSTVDRRTGKLLFKHYTKQEVQVLHSRWLRNVPEIPAWWDKTIEFWRDHGYVQEPVLGRRRYFAWQDTNAILNFAVQAGGFAVVVLGMLDIQKEIGFDYKRKVGLVNQMHDSVTYSVPKERAEEVKELVGAKLSRRLPNVPVDFTAKAKILERWQ